MARHRKLTYISYKTNIQSKKQPRDFKLHIVSKMALNRTGIQKGIGFGKGRKIKLQHKIPNLKKPLFRPAFLNMIRSYKQPAMCYNKIDLKSKINDLKLVKKIRGIL